LAPVFTLATDLIVGTAPPERAGSASGLSETSAELGGALGIAVLGSYVTVLYRSQMTSLPVDVPNSLAQIAHNTLGGAAAIAGDLPPQIGTALLEAARNAFTQGVVAAAAVCAALATAAAIMTVAIFRNAGADQPKSP
jgi:DHA2 family multidrug resistance protein-like MFS transporter